MDTPPWVEVPAPHEALEMVVVIPAYDERETLPEVLDALDLGGLEADQVEVWVCVNHSRASEEAVKEANRATLAELRRREDPFSLHIIDRASPGRAFDPEIAGVGEARRLLMDLAVARLTEVGRPKSGLIPCLDGDSPPDRRYLEDVRSEMREGGETALAGVCRHRHPIPEEGEHGQAMISYEAWMRYFEVALEHTGTPYAYQSIGSCMVLSAGGYVLAGGVPPREALSDFYLLQKVTKAGGWGSVKKLKEPMVRPSARPSTRVPRGTGPSVRASMEEGETRFVWVEPPEVFVELRRFFEAVRPGFSDPGVLREAASPAIRARMEDWGGWRTVAKLRRHAPDEARFERQFHTWFDSLKIVKCANRRREAEGGRWIFEAVAEIADEAGLETAPAPPSGEATLRDWRRLLGYLRSLEDQ